MKPVTQYDIARLAGVSRSAVQVVLRGGDTVSEETRQKVLRIIENTNYRPDPTAQSLARRKQGATTRLQTGCIGYTGLPTGPLSYSAHLLAGVQRAAERHGRSVMVLSQEPGPGWELVDGAVSHPTKTNFVAHAASVTMPLVSVMTGEPGPDGTLPACAVIPDNYDGGRQATEHLIELGHRRIAYLVDFKSNPVTQERVAGYRAALQTAGIEFDQRWLRLYTYADEYIECGYSRTAQWLQDGLWADLGCTALMTQNDRVAVGAIRAINEAGLRVPRDISVVGFDGTDECLVAQPRLTSIEVPLEAIGERAVELLIQQIDDAALVPQSVTMPVRLVTRDSAAPPCGGSAV